MILTYTPADGDAQRFVFKPDDMLNSEAEAIEKRTGWTWAEFLEQTQKGSTLARRVLLWTFLRRTHHTLRFEDVSFRQSEVVLAFDIDEMTTMRAAVADAPDRPGIDKEAFLAFMDGEIAKAVETEGKAPEKSGDSATSSPSPSAE